MSEYFGLNTNGDADNDYEAYARYYTAGYACPGSGTMNVLSLDANIALTAAGENIRMAIYVESDRSFVAQWDAEYEPGSTGWYTHGTFVNEGGSPIATVQLTAGTTYLLVLGCDGANLEGYYLDDTGAASYESTDYTGGFPDPLPAADGSSKRHYCLRCLVEAAAGGISIPAVMLQHDHFGGGQL